MSEETMIIQPKNESDKSKETKKSEATQEKNVVETSNAATKNNGSKKTVAAAAAGVAGVGIGGAAAAATLLNNDDNGEVEEKAGLDAPAKQSASSSSSQPAASGGHESETKSESEEMSINPQDTVPEKDDYNNNAPEQNPEAIPAKDEDSDDVQILGVYERDVDGVHQEVAVLTDGEEVAAIMDVDGDGEADIIGVDSNHSGSFEDHEIHDISDAHISMEPYEQEYLAQQSSSGQGGAPIFASNEHDYTNNGGANPVSQTSGTDDDVQILGVYERDVDGVHQEMAVLTDGEDVAAVVDLTGNGEADVVMADLNHNNEIEIEQGEVIDISDEHIQMETYEEAYIAQQSEMEQQEIETGMAQYEASDDQDYGNDMDCYEV